MRKTDPLISGADLRPMAVHRAFTPAAGGCLVAVVGGAVLFKFGASAAVVVLAGVGGVAAGLALSAHRAAGWARRVRMVTRIASALQDAADGERRGEALSVDDEGCDLAQAWNRILEERSDSQLGRALREAADAARGSGGGEIAARAVSMMPVGLLVVDAFGTVAMSNASAFALAGCAAERSTGMPVSVLFPEGEIADAIGRVRASGGSAAVTHHREDGTVVTAGVRAFREMREGRELLVLLEDGTREHLAAEARRSFVAHAAHELRSPLTNVRLYVEEAIDAGVDDPESVAASLNVIQTEARRLERVVDEMLSASEVESGALRLQTREVRLEQIFDELRADYTPAAEAAGVELRFELPPKYPVAHADREKLTLAIHNLVGNAIKYTDADGRVTVTVDASDSELSVRVSDTGIGIPEADRERVFERFFRVQDERVAERKGTGLGLCLAREVARKHGGDITVESEPGVGSTFTLVVPIGGTADRGDGRGGDGRGGDGRGGEQVRRAA